MILSSAACTKSNDSSPEAAAEAAKTPAQATSAKQEVAMTPREADALLASVGLKFKPDTLTATKQTKTGDEKIIYAVWDRDFESKFFKTNQVARERRIAVLSTFIEVMKSQSAVLAPVSKSESKDSGSQDQSQGKIEGTSLLAGIVSEKGSEQEQEQKSVVESNPYDNIWIVGARMELAQEKMDNLNKILKSEEKKAARSKAPKQQQEQDQNDSSSEQDSDEL